MTHFQVAGEFRLGVWRILITTLAISGFGSTNLSHLQVQQEESKPYYATAASIRNSNPTLLMEMHIFGGNNRAPPSADVWE